MKRFSLLLSLLFLCLITLISPVYASEGENPNIMEFPQKLSEAIGIPIFASQILLSSIILLMGLLPCAIWGKSHLPALIVGFCLMGFLIAVGWMPYWFLLMITLIVALMFAGKVREFITGKSGE